MFDIIQEYIQNLYVKHKQDKYLKKRGYKLPLSDAFFCAEDIFRNKKFYEAIIIAIKNIKKHKKKTFFQKILNNLKNKKTDNIIVIDAGSGTGLLGLYALVGGCDKVYFIENNPYTLNICKKIIKHFGYEKKSFFLNGDATKISLPENRDLLISETISTDFTTEDFHRIINHLLKRKNKNGIIIPSGIEIIFENNLGKNIKKRLFYSLNGFEKYKIEFNKVYDKIKVKTNIILYKNIIINCGESMSLGNERIINISSKKNTITFFD